MDAQEVDHLAQQLLGGALHEDGSRFWSRMQNDTYSPHAEAVLKAIRATQFAMLGDAPSAIEAVQSIPSNQRTLPYVASRLANVDGLLNVAAAPHIAVSAFKNAGELFQSEGNSWAVGATLINQAIAVCSSGRPEDSLIKLEEATEQCMGCDVPAAWISRRRSTICINRGGILMQLGRVSEAIAELVSARGHALTENRSEDLAPIDFNLAMAYRAARDYGSLIAAASSAVREYSAVGASTDALRSMVLLASGFRHANRYGEAEQLLRRVIQSMPDQPSGPSLVVELEAFDQLHTLLLNTGRSTEADQVLGNVNSLSRHLGREQSIVQELFCFVLSCIESLGKGLPPPPFELQHEVAELRMSRFTDNANEIVDVLLKMVEIFHNPGQPLDLTTTDRRALERLGISELDLRVMHLQADGLGGDTGATIDADLVETYLEGLDAGSQDSASTRAFMLESANRPGVGRLLRMLSATGDAATLFDLVESLRIDISSYAQEAAKLPRYSEIAAAGGTSGASLRAAKRLSIGGYSRLNRLVPSVEVVAAESLLEAIAGPHAVWLNWRIHEGRIYVIAMREDRTASAEILIDDRFRELMRQHSWSVPIISNLDREICGTDSPTWQHHAVCLARASLNPLVSSPEIHEGAMACLPRDIRDRLYRAIKEMPEFTLGVYEEMGGYLLPADLRPFTAIQCSGPARVVLSIPPSLANLPFALLETAQGSPLLAHFDIQVAPPIHLADRLSREAPEVGYGGRVDQLIVVTNPTGDLESAHWSGNVGVPTVVLGAPDPSVAGATGAWLLDPLGNPERSAFAFLGHVEAGSFLNPAGSALVLSGGAGGRLTALDIVHLSRAWPRVTYLGSCEGIGLGTGPEWASVAAAILASGGRTVVAHCWPLIDSQHARVVDGKLVGALASGGDPVRAINAVQRAMLQTPSSAEGSIPPHWWAGVQVVGMHN